MRYDEAAKKLGKELEAMGYGWRLEREGRSQHPKLYVKSGEVERFTPLSGTASYDNGNLLAMKMQDIRRDILPSLPPPVVAPPSSLAAPEPTQVAPEPVKVHAVKVAIMGKGQLAIFVPKAVIPPGAKVILIRSGVVVKLLLGKDGAEPRATRSENVVAFHFARKDVPFAYAAKNPTGRPPKMMVRELGQTLVFDKPWPDSYLSDGGAEEPVKTNGTTYHPGSRMSVPDADASASTGSMLLKQLNAWIDKQKRRKEVELQVRVDSDGHVRIELQEIVIQKRTL